MTEAISDFSVSISSWMSACSLLIRSRSSCSASISAWVTAKAGMAAAITPRSIRTASTMQMMRVVFLDMFVSPFGGQCFQTFR